MKLFGRSFQIQQSVISALAGLLIFYHTYTLYDLYLGSGTDLYGGGSANAHSLYVYVQSSLRVAIVFSLLFVVIGKRNKRLALYGMWAAISALIASHYWAHFLNLPFHFLEGRHPFSYLKGFVIPTVITLLSLSMHRQRTVGKEA